MINLGDKVVYWYQMNRPGVVVGFVKDSSAAVWLEGSAPSIPVRAVVRFENGEETTYTISDLRLADQ
jgi:hypothetical protein